MLIKQRSETPELEEAAVESMQKEDRGTCSEHSNRKGIRCAEIRELKPSHLLSKMAGQWIEKPWDAFNQKALQERTGLGWDAPTMASSSAPEVTGKGSRCRSEPSRQAKSQTR